MEKIKQQIIQEVKNTFNNISSLPEIDSIEKYEKRIDDYHKHKPIDEELIIYEALMLLIPPLTDYMKALELLNKIDTQKGIILKATIEHQNIGIINDHLILKLQTILKTVSDLKIKSVLYYLLSQTEEGEQRIVKLKKSIECNPSTSLSYIELANIYGKRKDKEQCVELYEKGISNIRKIIKENDKISLVDYDFFIDENIRGIIVSEEIYKYYIECQNKARKAHS